MYHACKDQIMREMKDEKREMKDEKGEKRLGQGET